MIIWKNIVYSFLNEKINELNDIFYGKFKVRLKVLNNL